MKRYEHQQHILPKQAQKKYTLSISKAPVISEIIKKEILSPGICIGTQTDTDKVCNFGPICGTSCLPVRYVKLDN